MFCMLIARPKPGISRERLVERLTRQLHPETWDLVRRGELSHILYNIGQEPGFFAVLSAPSLESAEEMVVRGAQRLELFDIEIVPVNQFPHFEE